jgi:4-hydroxy-3-polyprenylbenzoate decarboxylase
MSDLPIVLAMTGASGAIYGLRLAHVLLASGRNVELTISPAGAIVLKEELGLAVDPVRVTAKELFPSVGALPTKLQQLLRDGKPLELRSTAGTLHAHAHTNFFSAIASGSARSVGMVICPCSGDTLGAIAHGTGGNLIHRAAAVHLKERRTLILVPRETPLSSIYLENLQRAAQAGATILPAMPGFYQGVSQVMDLVDFVVARVCDHLQVEHGLGKRWGDA